ncbi:class I adenylate-forming enzyme family protein [Streptomyces sp. NPDC002446]
MPRFTYPELPLDALLRRAAVRDPGGLAIRTEAESVCYAELDGRADALAAYLDHEVGRRGAAIGVANSLDIAFACSYYGTSRSGNTVVLVNPLISKDGLRHVFTAAGIEVAFVPAATAEPLTAIRHELPKLRTIVVTDAHDSAAPPGTVPLSTALRPYRDRPAGLGAGRADLEAIACIQFTTGTTGLSKGVRLTHRNLVANAAQIALAHRLGSDSVTLNHLPLYHVMHLNSAVYAGAAQVLCADPDPVRSLALAAEVEATHYYGLPARLHRLAADDRLSGPLAGVPAGPRLTAVMSGGTALSPSAAHTLSQKLRVPVIQGYGMAELAPLTHNQLPEHPVPGSVGPALAGTECRLVHLETRQPVRQGEPGEVQVRGPQLMAGYLDEQQATGIDADGWFSTGDIGHVNQDGVLFLTDRLGDVFKYDNELVSPTAVERVVAEDPRVAECVVVGQPDAVHGAVVWAGIVLRDPAAKNVPHTLDAVVATANTRLAPFERIRSADALDAVPRTPTGKPQRGELRRWLGSRATTQAAG